MKSNEYIMSEMLKLAIQNSNAPAVRELLKDTTPSEDLLPACFEVDVFSSQAYEVAKLVIDEFSREHAITTGVIEKPLSLDARSPHVVAIVEYCASKRYFVSSAR